MQRKGTEDKQRYYVSSVHIKNYSANPLDISYKEISSKYAQQWALPYITPLWGTLWLPRDVPIAKTLQLTYFPCNPVLWLTLTLHPIMMTCSHLFTPHSLTQHPHTPQCHYTTYPFDPLRSTSSIWFPFCHSSTFRLCCSPPSFPDYWNNPYSWDTDAGSDWDL